MTLTTPATSQVRITQGAKRFGYFVAAVANGVMLWIAHNLLDWDLFPWLTQEFDDLLPILTTSFVVSIVVNLLYVGYDAKWFKSLTQIPVNAIGLFVSIRVWQVFPFDFSAYDFPWRTLARAVIIVAIVGTAIGLIVETAKFLRALGQHTESSESQLL